MSFLARAGFDSGRWHLRWRSLIIFWPLLNTYMNCPRISTGVEEICNYLYQQFFFENANVFQLIFVYFVNKLSLIFFLG